MPFRLICILILVVFEGAFIGFNLENKCDVWLVFRVFEAVPVYITILVAFGAGVLFTIPFFVFNFKKGKGRASAKKERDAKGRDAREHASSPVAPVADKRIFGKKRVVRTGADASPDIQNASAEPSPDVSEKPSPEEKA